MSTPHDSSLSLSNLLRPEIQADPYVLYRQIRESDPVHWDEPMGFWALARYADVMAALHDSRLSKAKGMAAALDRIPDAEREVAEPVYRFFSRQMLYADPPYHTQLRALVNKAFTPRVVEGMRAHIQQIVDDLLDAVQADGRMDVIRQLGYPLPLTVIMELLGLPREMCDPFKTWSDDFIATLGVVRRSPHIFHTARESLAEFRTYFSAFHAQLRARPGDDLLSRLVKAEVEGSRLTPEELEANAMLLLAAGHETTVNLIGNGLLALLRNPDQMEKLRRDPPLIASTVEEVMRYDNAVQIVWRLATEDLQIGGKTIGKGQFVNCLVGAANRDPAQYPEPDRFDITRREGRHAGFGLGIHFCLGAPLARLEGQIALSTLLRRLPGIRLETEELQWQVNPTFHALKALPVVF